MPWHLSVTASKMFDFDSNCRLIKDPVHGYVRVPCSLFDKFIDTERFQRLRSIEQTSMRWLFPGGRHDRFIHSIGVFHLAHLTYDALVRNVSDAEVSRVLRSNALQETFLIAALMHDCGHAPFSHTFEDYYNAYCDECEHNEAYGALNDVLRDVTRDDMLAHEQSANPPAPHEAMSAYVLLRYYHEAMKGCGIVDCDLAARMITGCRHSSATTVQLQVENELIGLLNGFVIDVDKLDYIIRDTWASGVQNFNIDVPRLVAGSTLVRPDGGRVTFAYRQMSLGVVQTVIDARNHLYEWIYGHHTVLYYSEVLRRAVKQLGVELSNLSNADVQKDNPREILRRMFSVAMFEHPVSLITGMLSPSVFLLSDGDVLFLLKTFCKGDPWRLSYCEHQPKHFALWKTAAEYRMLIHKDRQYRISLGDCVVAVRTKFGLSEDECFACKDMSHKLSQIKENSVMIEMRPGVIRSLRTVANLPSYQEPPRDVESPAFYLYLPNSFRNRRDEVVEFINGLDKSAILAGGAPHPLAARCPVGIVEVNS